MIHIAGVAFASVLCGGVAGSTAVAKQWSQAFLQARDVASESTNLAFNRRRRPASESVATKDETSDEGAAPDQALCSGDAVNLWAANGQRLDLSNGVLRGTTPESRGVAGIVVELEGDNADAEIRSGDRVYLKTRQGGHMITTSGKVLKGTGQRKKQAFIIESFNAPGDTERSILVGEAVFLKATSGKVLGLKEDGTLALQSEPPSQEQLFTTERLPFGGLHDIVGNDGVFMISLEKRSTQKRRDHTLTELGRANVFPMHFPATDADNAPEDALELACPIQSTSSNAWCSQMGKSGAGCKSPTEQATTDSHRRALVAALWREDSPEWTAIIEDDSVPVQGAAWKDWGEEFKQQWQNLPKEALIVRLGMCSFESDVGAVEEEVEPSSASGSFQFVRRRWWSDATGVNHYYTGGCTTGYLVHKSIIPEILQIFPCCCSFDCCLERQLFYARAADGSDDDLEQWWGAKHLVDMQALGARTFSQGFASFNQSGVLVQDHRFH